MLPNSSRLENEAKESQNIGGTGIKEREKQDWRAGDGVMTFVLIVGRCYRRQLWQCEAAARIIGLHIGGASSVSNKTLTLTRTRRNMQGAYHLGGQRSTSAVCAPPQQAGQVQPDRQTARQTLLGWRQRNTTRCASLPSCWSPCRQSAG